VQGGYKGVTRMAYSPSLWLMANWLVKQNQPVSKIETKSDTNLRSFTVLLGTKVASFP